MVSEQPRDTRGATYVGSGHYLRVGPDNEVWWSHPECRGWHPSSNHRFTFGSGGITIYGSLLCPDTGVHGFVTNGVWRDA